ncbi:hypothetical protein [Sunxiuqinia indica]|uniref:hypothetical protein n=1 Tax=Sunxiuqinia indica TaxID=2692584 RepID=UPI001356B362|nr:hypothetical protein [Sunxiuqinia indica]
MKKIFEKLKQAWQWLDGKKTTLGAAAGTGLFIANLVKPGLIPNSTYVEVQAVISMWTGFGLFSKAKKQKW